MDDAFQFTECSPAVLSSATRVVTSLPIISKTFSETNFLSERPKLIVVDGLKGLG